MMDRRTFLSWVGMGWVASSLPIALAACNSNQSTTTQSPATDKQSPAANQPRPDGFVKVGTVAQLDTGAIVVPQSPLGPVTVVRNQGTLTAVNPTCTHAGCAVAWQPSGEYVCPCHKAKYSATGAVTQGPAKTSLKVYQAKIEGNDVLVKATA